MAVKGKLTTDNFPSPCLLYCVMIARQCRGVLRRLRTACYDCRCSILGSRKQLATGSFTSREPSSRYSLSGGCFACTSCECTHYHKHDQRTTWRHLPGDLQAFAKVPLVCRKLWPRECGVIPNDSQDLVLFKSSKKWSSNSRDFLPCRHKYWQKKLSSGRSLAVKAVSPEIDHLGTVCNCA